MRFVALLLAILTVVTPLTAEARRGKKTRASKRAKAPYTAPAGSSTTDDPQALLAQAKASFDALEYDDAQRSVDKALATNALVGDALVEALVLSGSVRAILGDTIDAEASFLRLLRERPDYDMSATTEPKVLAVFRKVQVEERMRLTQLREERLRDIVANMTIDGSEPVQAVGGQPIDFVFDVADPSGSAASVQVLYRRQGQTDFSSLAMQRSTDARWVGSIPADATESDTGMQMEWIVTTYDENGVPLATRGSTATPLRTMISAGKIARATPFYKTWWFWTLTGVAVVGAGAAGYIANDNARQLPASDLGAFGLDR